MLAFPAVSADRCPVVGGQLLFEMADRALDRHFRQCSHRRHYFFERGESAQIARDQAQHDLFAQAAQGAPV